MSLQNSPYIVGSGARKIICLNGWFGYAQGWGAFTECLDGDEFTYAFMDYRGYGSRQGSGGPYTVAQMAQDGEALADQLGWHAFALLGHAMGGGVAQYLLANAPERVQALVAVAPVSARGVALGEADRNAFFRSASDVTARREIIDQITGHRLSAAWLEQMAQASVSRADPTAFESYLTAWTQTDFAERIAGKTTPVLVITGDHDPGWGVEIGKDGFEQYYPNAEFKVLANAGHYPMHEVPAEFAALVEDYLVQHMPR